MSDFDDAALDLNAARLDVFGEFFTYRVPGGVSVSITGVRADRGTEQNEQLAAFERVWTRTGQFGAAGAPSKGDVLVMGTEPYIVIDCKPDTDPSSDGITLYLNRKLPSL